MTAMPSDVARKQPAQVAPRQRERRVINGHVVSNKRPGPTFAGALLFALMAILFLGFVLSLMQQA